MRKVILVSCVVLLLVGLIAAWNFAGIIYWDGICPREVRILVLDASSSQPIARAKVALVSPQWELVEKYPSAMEASAGDEGSLSRFHPSTETDTAGRCKLLVEFPADGTQTMFGKRGSFHITGKLDVERPGAPSVRLPLYELISRIHYPISYHSPIDVTVKLEAGTTGDGLSDPNTD